MNDLHFHTLDLNLLRVFDTLIADIGRSYNVSAATISRLTA
jgi:hypothetical protein